MMMKDQADGWYEGMLNNKSGPLFSKNPSNPNLSISYTNQNSCDFIGFIPATYVEKVVGGGSAMQASKSQARPTVVVLLHLVLIHLTLGRAKEQKRAQKTVAKYGGAGAAVGALGAFGAGVKVFVISHIILFC